MSFDFVELTESRHTNAVKFVLTGHGGRVVNGHGRGVASIVDVLQTDHVRTANLFADIIYAYLSPRIGHG